MSSKNLFQLDENFQSGAQCGALIHDLEVKNFIVSYKEKFKKSGPK